MLRCIKIVKNCQEQPISVSTATVMSQFMRVANLNNYKWNNIIKVWLACQSRPKITTRDVQLWHLLLFQVHHFISKSGAYSKSGGQIANGMTKNCPEISEHG